MVIGIGPKLECCPRGSVCLYTLLHSNTKQRQSAQLIFQHLTWPLRSGCFFTREECLAQPWVCENLTAIRHRHQPCSSPAVPTRSMLQFSASHPAQSSCHLLLTISFSFLSGEGRGKKRRLEHNHKQIHCSPAPIEKPCKTFLFFFLS